MSWCIRFVPSHSVNIWNQKVKNMKCWFYQYFCKIMILLCTKAFVVLNLFLGYFLRYWIKFSNKFQLINTHFFFKIDIVKKKVIVIYIEYLSSKAFSLNCPALLHAIWHFCILIINYISITSLIQYEKTNISWLFLPPVKVGSNYDKLSNHKCCLNVDDQFNMRRQRLQFLNPIL